MILIPPAVKPNSWRCWRKRDLRLLPGHLEKSRIPRLTVRWRKALFRLYCCCTVICIMAFSQKKTWTFSQRLFCHPSLPAVPSIQRSQWERFACRLVMQHYSTQPSTDNYPQGHLACFKTSHHRYRNCLFCSNIWGQFLCDTILDIKRL